MARLGRPLVSLVLTAEETDTLARWARRPSSAQALAQRARMVLAAAAGTPCGTGDTCDGKGACVAPNGDTCAAGGECASGFCPDGFCCATACDGACQACSTLKKGSGANGTCGNIANGTDPQSECSGASTCDGAGMCTP